MSGAAEMGGDGRVMIVYHIGRDRGIGLDDDDDDEKGVFESVG